MGSRGKIGETLKQEGAMARVLKMLALLASMSFLVSCVDMAPSGVTHSADKFDGTSRDAIQLAIDLDPKNGATLSQATCSASVSRHLTENSTTPTYVLTVAYKGPDWIFIGEGQTLTLLLNGTDRMLLSGTGSSGFRDTGVDITPTLGGLGYLATNREYGISEIASYPVTRQQLLQIAASSKVEIKLSGEKADETGSIKDVYIQRIGEFLALFPKD